MVMARLWLVLAVLGLLAVAIVACSAEPVTTPTTSRPLTVEEPGEPVLSTTLKRGCSPADARGNFGNAGLSIGETAVNFTLGDIHGTEFRLSRLLAEKPVMMVFGSFT